MATLTTTRPDAARKDETSALRRHTSLCIELSITQFKLKYTGSALGYLWSLLKPLGYFGILYVVFVSIFKIGNDTSPNFAAQLLLGIVLWTFFQEATSAATGSIISSGNLIRKAAFPRIVLVIAATLTASITFVINLLLIVVIAASLGQMHLDLRSLAAVPLLIELYVLVLGVSLILSSLCVYYRDVGHLWEIFSQVLFYSSAIVFPVVLVQGRWMTQIIGVNPVAQIVEDTRRALVLSDPRIPWAVNIDGWLYIAPLAIVALVAIGGLFMFNRLAPRFAELL